MINVVTCTTNQFENLITEKNIICFGAGQALHNLSQIYPNISQKLKCVVDNYSFGKPIVLAGREIPVIPFTQLDAIDKNDLFIISTTGYADQIVRQLDEIEKMDGVNVFIPYFLKKNSSKLTKMNSKQVIPKKIHFCWFGGKEIPVQFQKNIESWKKNCPDYEIICWNESNYDVTKCSYMYEAYQSKKWGFVPDYARLDIIYRYGGIYLDTDVEVLRPWDELLGYELFCGFESRQYVNFGLGFGACAGNTILKEMMNQYEEMHFVNPDGTSNQIASPIYQTQILNQHGLKCNDEFQVIENCAIFPTEYFAPIDGYGEGIPSIHSFSIHQFAGTWFDETMIKNREDKKKVIAYIKNRMKDL